MPHPLLVTQLQDPGKQALHCAELTLLTEAGVSWLHSSFLAQVGGEMPSQLASLFQIPAGELAWRS